MNNSTRPLSLLDQRRIEAGVLAPVIQAFQREFGDERTNAIVRDVIENLARASGRELADRCDGGSMETLKSIVPLFTQDGALELDVLEDNESSYGFNVTRCQYAEMYRELGVPELGRLLSCNRDFALTEGLGDDLHLERTQTIMDGAPHCDFRFRTKNADDS